MNGNNFAEALELTTQLHIQQTSKQITNLQQPQRHIDELLLFST